MKITVIGFMGAGKSYFAKKFSNLLDMKFIDLDKVIEHECRMSISNIFNINGEKFFREKEEKFLRRELQEDNIILSLGGGCCMNENNAGIIKKESFCIFLNTPFETCYERISKNSLRPLATNNTQEKLREIYDGRLGRYMELADMTIFPNELSDDNFEKLAEKIKAELLKIQK